MKFLLLVSLAILPCAAQAKQEADPLAEFNAHVADYMKQRKDAHSKVTPLKPTVSSNRIREQEKGLRGSIQDQRTDDPQGTIFTAPVAAYFHQRIDATLQGPEGKKIRQSMAHAEPVKVKLAVNQPYPPDLPLQSTPPTLLVNLPKVPSELDYRIVGQTLVLRDVSANLVVDLLPNALR